MDKSIVFIIPYFGNFPNYFQAWLKTCEKNSDIEFYIFSDIKLDFKLPENVKLFSMTLNEIKNRISEIVGFECCLNNAYKLCDYKPAYGEIFQDYISAFEYWGFCDMDLLWGNIREFITGEILENNEIILTRGHCSIFKNISTVNAYYRTLECGKYQDYKSVFMTSENRAFDEWAAHKGGGLSYILHYNKKQMYDEKIYCDLKTKNYKFVPTSKEISTMSKFHVCKEGLVGIDKNGKERSFLYVHFQKRPIAIDKEIRYEDFYFIPPILFSSNSNAKANIKYILEFYKMGLKRKIKKFFLKK